MKIRLSLKNKKIHQFHEEIFDIVNSLNLKSGNNPARTKLNQYYDGILKKYQKQRFNKISTLIKIPFFVPTFKKGEIVHPLYTKIERHSLSLKSTKRPFNLLGKS